MVLVSGSTGTVVVREELAPSPSTFDAIAIAAVTTAAAVPAMRHGVQRVGFEVEGGVEVDGGVEVVRDARDEGRDAPEVRPFFFLRGLRCGAGPVDDPGERGPDVGAVP